MTTSTSPASGPPFGGGEHLDDSLSAFLDGELEEAAHQAAYEHLAACALCQSDLESLTRVRTALRAAPEVDPPFGFIEAVIQSRSTGPTSDSPDDHEELPTTPPLPRPPPDADA
jgi:hypothetical protein